MTQLISIVFQKNGEGTLNAHGLSSGFHCLGKPDVKYPRDLTIKGEEGVDKFPMWYSREFGGAQMPWAILIWGQRGIFIHQGPATVSNGDRSQGCIRLPGSSAKTVYDWITGRTRITISYPW